MLAGAFWFKNGVFLAASIWPVVFAVRLCILLGVVVFLALVSFCLGFEVLGPLF